MSTRRTRAASRREESLEPQDPPVSAVARRTRNGSKRAEVSDQSPQSQPTQPPRSGIPQRGTRRKRRRSLESVATNDFPKSSAEHASPEQVLTAAAQPVDAEEVTASNAESQNDSYEDRAARLQDILDFDLPKLHRWCGKAYEILSSLTQPEPTQEERKSLNTARKSFNLARRPLVDDDATYIDLSSSDLPYRDDPDVHATIDKATRSANLITLLLSLTDLNHAKKAISPFLQELDDAFPSLFDTDLSRQSQTHELALHIRCRQLVEWLGEEPESEPLILATTIFCKDSASTAEEAAQRLRKGPFRKLGDMAQSGNFTSSRKFTTHMEQIIAKLSVPERDKSEKLLNAAFPQDKILEELRVWALNLYAHVNSKADKRNLPPDDRNEARVGREESEGLFISENDEAGESSDSESSSEHEGYHQLKTLVKEPSFIQDPATLAAVRQSEKRGSRHPRTGSPTRRQPARGRLTGSQVKDAILRLDPAEILGPPHPGHGIDNGTVSRPTGASYHSRSSSVSEELGAARENTRTREDEDHVEDDDDFEVNEQLIDESRRAYHESSNVSRPVPKRPRFAENPGTVGGRSGSPDNTPASTNLQERDLAALSQAARANKLANKGRGHQIRERWSHADTDLLLDMIADQELNCSWSAMERKGGFQTYRSQQAIRDKARNLKKGYLCADAILPSGFDYVHLGKKERAEVIASGHNPYRTEDDIDKRGRVVRSLWQERER